MRKDIFMEGSHTRIVEETEQNAATLGVSLAVLEPLLGPWVCNMPILDLDDVGVNRKPVCMGIFIWEGHILALRGGQSKMQQFWGCLWSF